MNERADRVLRGATDRGFAIGSFCPTVVKRPVLSISPESPLVAYCANQRDTVCSVNFAFRPRIARHQENWGIISFPEGVRLAPIYDTAACLGAELQPQHRLLTPRASEEQLKQYVERCGSGFGRGQNHLIGQREVVAQLKTSWPAEWHR